MRILVVDDNKDMADSTALLLSLHGHEAQLGLNALAAIERARDYSPDVAIIDIGLPPLDGYEVAPGWGRSLAWSGWSSSS